MEEAQRKLDSPKIRLIIRTSVANDSSKLKKYYIHSINVYPDADYELVENDSTLKTVNIDQINIYSHYENFHPWQLRRMIPLKKGDVFSCISLFLLLYFIYLDLE